MPNPIDLTNLKFNKLTAKYIVTSKQGRKWYCACDCGEHISVSAANLRSGKIRSCGCLRANDLTGKTFNQLTFLNRTDNAGKNTMWAVQCKCGTIKSMQPAAVTSGKVISCGCYIKKQKTIHGHSKHPLYSTWKHMISRCHNPLDRAFKNYGARGISVCDAWRNSFLAFVNDMGDKPSDYEIDRKDNNGNYCKENCHWVSPEINSNNRRSSVKLTFDGKTLSIMQWSRLTGINRTTISARLASRWPIHKALT